MNDSEELRFLRTYDSHISSLCLRLRWRGKLSFRIGFEVLVIEWGQSSNQQKMVLCPESVWSCTIMCRSRSFLVPNPRSANSHPCTAHLWRRKWLSVCLLSCPRLGKSFPHSSHGSDDSRLPALWGETSISSCAGTISRLGYEFHLSTHVEVGLPSVERWFDSDAQAHDLAHSRNI